MNLHAPHTRRRRLSIATLLLTMALARTASATNAASRLERARALFEQGETAFREGRFRDAASAYRHAYELAPRAKLLINIGQSYRNAAAYQRAIEAYRQFIGAEPQSPLRGEVERVIAECQRLDTELKRTPAVPPAETTKQPVPPAELGPRPTETARDEMVCTAGCPAPKTVMADALSRSSWLWTGAAISAAWTVSGMVTGVLALRKNQQYRDRLDSAPRQDLVSLRDAGKRLSTISTIGFALAGVTALSTVTYWWLSEPERPTRLSLAPGDKGVAVILSGAFR